MSAGYRLHAISAGVRDRDDRATVEAKPEDVGDQALIRGFKPQFRGSSGAVRCLRAGVDRLIGHKATSGIPLPWDRPPRWTIFFRVAVRAAFRHAVPAHDEEFGQPLTHFVHLADFKAGDIEGNGFRTDGRLRDEDTHEA